MSDKIRLEKLNEIESLNKQKEVIESKIKQLESEVFSMDYKEWTEYHFIKNKSKSLSGLFENEHESLSGLFPDGKFMND